jgi:hypothetical protein
MTPPAAAQQPVYTVPLRAPTKNLSGTIAVTNTFQSIAAADVSTQRGRVGCQVQNNGSNPMYVYFGPVASALTSTALSLAVGATLTCSTGSGGVLTDQVSITGTAGDAFYAGFQ